MCSDGVVLGVDSLYSRAHLKTSGKKMFTLKGGSNYKILIAGSGNADSVKKAVDVIGETLSDQFPRRKAATLRSLRDWIEAALTKVFKDHIDSAPEKQQEELHFELLLAVNVNGKATRLFRTNRTMVISERRRACIGTGLYLAEYVMDLVLGSPQYRSITTGALVAVYTIAVTKKYIQYVGKRSTIYTMDNGGHCQRISQNDIASTRLDFSNLFEWLSLSLDAVQPELSDQTAELVLNGISSSFRRFRNNEATRRANRPTLVAPYPRLPKRDQSQGSPGGSSES
jgi:hypothetical protein